MEKNKRIALDVDGVCLDFSSSFIELAKRDKINLYEGKVWNFFDQDIRSYDLFKNLKLDFWLNLNRTSKSIDLNFIPSAYISHRNCPEEITRQSLLKNGFPDAPVIHVKHTEDKVNVFKNLQLDVFVDDRASTVMYFLENGLEAYVLKYHYNCDFNLPSINTLGELYNKINEKDQLYRSNGICSKW